MGIVVARALQNEIRGDNDNAPLIIDAGSAPENFTGALRRFHPDLVLIVDAAEMNRAPGTVELLAWQDTRSLTASTHTLPLAMFAHYLETEIECPSALIGIQSAQTNIGCELSPPVRLAARRVTQQVLELL